MPAPLPIDPFLPEIARELASAGALVIEAEPGAGKTTRVPPALAFGEGRAAAGEVVVLEPRRLAARLAARRVAAELGERPGERVGWQVRFEDVSSPATRLRFLTEGILTRRLRGDPALAGVGTVVLDEFHERHLHGDVALALLERLRRGPRRADLRLVVMSATMDSARVAAFLDAPVIRVPGRVHEVALAYEPGDPALALEQRVADALERLLERPPGLAGHALVFLPGAAEIARARDCCAALAARHDLVLLPLHGGLPPEEQDLALRESARRKVILATNVAESSVTIEGVVAVIDSGLARVAGHSPWSGLPTLRVEPVSRASAAQRAGRAGRTGPGRCVRLYARRDFDARPAFPAPEIERADLAETALELRAAGIADLAVLRWFEPPRAAALEAADSLLARLGALDRARRLTPLGARMLKLPLHPRLARVAIAAADRGAGRAGATLAAILGERDIRAGARAGALGRGGPRGPRRDAASDVLELLALFERRAPGLDRAAAQAVAETAREIARILQPADGAADREEALLQALLAGHPDRVARRRGDELTLADGARAKIAGESVARAAEWLVAVDAEERPGPAGALVRLASEIEPGWLVDLFPEDVREAVEATWNAGAERVDVVSRLCYGALVLEESRGLAAPAGAVEEVLAKAALAAGPAAFADREALALFLGRAAFARTLAPEVVPELTDTSVSEALRALCAGRRSFAELRAAGLLDALARGLPPPARAALGRLAPETATLPSGRRARIRYEPGRAPFVESRLQDFFGAKEGPRVGAGRVPLVLHLLAPNGRAVQVTTDLAGFWERHYPSIRRELARRYPKHAWPEDPRGAG
jgi:ATP-dependent helicase HrpB